MLTGIADRRGQLSNSRKTPADGNKLRNGRNTRKEVGSHLGLEIFRAFRVFRSSKTMYRLLLNRCQRSRHAKNSDPLRTSSSTMEATAKAAATESVREAAATESVPKGTTTEGISRNTTVPESTTEIAAAQTIAQTMAQIST
jgi:hypothetical protein